MSTVEEAHVPTKPVEPPVAVAEGSRRLRWTAWAQRYGVLVALVGLFAYNAVATPYFLTRQQLLLVLLRQTAPVAIVAVGMALVIGTGGIDLSVGSVMAISGQVGALIYLHHGGSIPVAIVAALAVSAFCGVFNGTLVARFGVQPIIATLILFIAGRGIAQLITGGQLQVLASPSFQWMGIGRIASVPAQVLIMLVVATVFALVMRLTVFGRYVVSVGGNASATRIAGIPAARVILLVYVISALLAGLTGLIQIGNDYGSDANNTGLGMELAAIAAVAVAGTSLMGGRVRIWATVAGAVTLTMLANTFIAHGLTKHVADMIEGVVIVLALYVQRQES
jgi:simple sugar transport system permease protein/ribose transport system permease protein